MRGGRNPQANRFRSVGEDLQKALKIMLACLRVSSYDNRSSTHKISI